MYARTHTLSTTSTQKSSQADNGPVRISKSIFSLNSQARHFIEHLDISQLYMIFLQVLEKRYFSCSKLQTILGVLKLNRRSSIRIHPSPRIQAVHGLLYIMTGPLSRTRQNIKVQIQPELLGYIHPFLPLLGLSLACDQNKKQSSFVSGRCCNCLI